MPCQESDADILSHVARRLFAESREEFRAAHRRWMEICDTLTHGEYLRRFDEALEQEGRAFRKQCEAIELQRKAIELRQERWANLKATWAGRLLKS